MAMRVKFNTSAVLITGESFAQNQVAELDDTLAAALVGGGIVEQMDATVPEGYLLGAGAGATPTTTTKTNNGKAKGKATVSAETVE